MIKLTIAHQSYIHVQSYQGVWLTYSSTHNVIPTGWVIIVDVGYCEWSVWSGRLLFHKHINVRVNVTLFQWLANFLTWLETVTSAKLAHFHQLLELGTISIMWIEQASRNSLKLIHNIMDSLIIQFLSNPSNQANYNLSQTNFHTSVMYVVFFFFLADGGLTLINAHLINVNCGLWAKVAECPHLVAKECNSLLF